VGVVAGSAYVPGAALLAGQAALRVGAGKLHIATASSAQPGVAIAVPEAKVSPVWEDSSGNLLRLRRTTMAELARSDALLVGPGLDACTSSARLLNQLSKSCGCPFVLDAGGLEGFMTSLRAPDSTIITPHFGEMARLLGRSIREVEDDPAPIAIGLATRSGAVVVLKSPTTYVAAPDGSCWVHEDGSVGLGTSGSGDVLAGLIVGLLARGASLIQAAVWGVRLHGKAGERLALRLGPVGFMASEIGPEVPALLRELDPHSAHVD
jgi:hydroxyethylthiazole kinase-like uncharacterized protein yjeF